MLTWDFSHAIHSLAYIIIYLTHLYRTKCEKQYYLQIAFVTLQAPAIQKTGRNATQERNQWLTVLLNPFNIKHGVGMVIPHTNLCRHNSSCNWNVLQLDTLNFDEKPATIIRNPLTERLFYYYYYHYWCVSLFYIIKYYLLFNPHYEEDYLVFNLYFRTQP